MSRVGMEGHDAATITRQREGRNEPLRLLRVAGNSCVSSLSGALLICCRAAAEDPVAPLRGGNGNARAWLAPGDPEGRVCCGVDIEATLRCDDIYVAMISLVRRAEEPVPLLTGPRALDQGRTESTNG